MAATMDAGTTRPSWARRSYLVDRGLQLKLGILMAVCAAFVAVAVGAWLQSAHTAAITAPGVDYVARRSAEATHRLVLTIFAGAAAAGAIAAGLAGVVVAHRVAGPAMVMRRYVASMAKGRYPRIRGLRRHDELTDLFSTLADAVARLREREERQVENLEQVLEAMRSASGRAPELAEAIGLLEQELTDRRKALELGPAREPAQG